jgi:hypothetical protein
VTDGARLADDQDRLGALTAIVVRVDPGESVKVAGHREEYIEQVHRNRSRSLSFGNRLLRTGIVV